jgi:hypothetical protein
MRSRAPSRARLGEASPRARSAVSRCSFPSGAGSRSPELTGKERRFVGPKVYWFEAYGKWADTDVPNEMWSNRPVGQLEKCAEAGALRHAFPEEIGNALTAEEMEGQHTLDGAAPAPEKPKPESVTPPSAGGERKPLPPLVSQPQSLTAASSAEFPEPFAARQEGDPEIPHALAHE